MRRQIAFLPVFIMMICGCNKADDDTAPYDSVRFDVQTESSTRGSVIGGTTLPATETFRVYAWKTVGSETTVMMTRDAADQESNVVSNQQGVWTTKRRYYWPTDDGATVSFYAFYPKDHAVVKNGDDVKTTRGRIAVREKLPEEFNVLRNRLSQFFQAKVQMTCSAKGKGKISIPFDNEEELERIMNALDKVHG